MACELTELTVFVRVIPTILHPLLCLDSLSTFFTPVPVPWAAFSPRFSQTKYHMPPLHLQLPL